MTSPGCLDTTDELTTALESLPSYENLQPNQNESAVFDADHEPSTGLINRIRKTSIHDAAAAAAASSVRIILKMIHFLRDYILIFSQ